MTTVSDVVDTFRHSLAASTLQTEPYRHWLLRDALPADSARAIQHLPFAPADIAGTKGKRETNNQSRVFFSEENRARFPVCDQVAKALQSRLTTAAIERTCGITLEGANLRIEYCQDTGDFWLEPHTDIAEKLFTMLVYLSDEPESEGWGTDIYDPALNYVGSAPYGFDLGLIFIPGRDTWHGFRRRPISGIRRSIIVNYVKSNWRARHELSFPDTPIGQSARSSRAVSDREVTS